MADRIYTIPLRREFQKAPHKRKSNKAIKALKEFVAKHMKAEKVIVGEELNELIWKNGITNPPPKVQVECTKMEEGVFVNLVGFKKKVIETKKTNVLQKTTMKDKLTETMKDLKEGKTKSDKKSVEVKEENKKANEEKKETTTKKEKVEVSKKEQKENKE